MYRARQLSAVLGPTLAAALFVGLPEAEAASPKRVGGFDQGGYIFLTPSSVVPTERHHYNPRIDYIHARDPSFGWGFGGGGMFPVGRLFKATVGGVFEHTVLFFSKDFSIGGGHIIRFMPEIRTGLGNDKVWGYGLCGAGIAGVFWHTEHTGFIYDVGTTRYSGPAFNVQSGGGIQGIVWKNLFLGGEFDFDLGWGRHNYDRNFRVFTVAFEFMLGWYF